MAELNSEGKYADLQYTNFPAAVDSWEDVVDVTSETLALANQYGAYCKAGNYEAARNLLESDTSGNLRNMQINAYRINRMSHALMAIERMWRDDLEKYVIDQVFEESIMIGEYKHTYDSVKHVHNFTGKGNNAKVMITASYSNGDTFALNGTPVNAYMGGAALKNLFRGQYMYFIVGSGGIYFIGGGDTSSLLPKSGGTMTGDLYYGSANGYYTKTDGSSKLASLVCPSITSSGTISANTISATGNITGAKVYGAVYNDYAEWFERGEDTEPGDIIALDTDSAEERYVKADSKHTAVVGVHSNEYYEIIGGKAYDNEKDYFEKNLVDYIPVGLAGRVRTKVTGKLRVGDMIVPSDIPGVGIAYNGDCSNQMNVIGRVVSVEDGEGIRFARVLLK